ncbi:MAG: hypothetical protein ACFFD5_09745 [Candidatus Thorarchaeota archaeon]
MSDLKDLFQKWNDLNTKAQASFGNFDFSKIKEIRTKQKKIEDSIYEILKNNASDQILNMLPDDCGQMEVGYDTEESVFYFVMFDPEFEEEDETKLIALTLDLNKNVSIKKDFKIEDS